MRLALYHQASHFPIRGTEADEAFMRHTRVLTTLFAIVAALAASGAGQTPPAADEPARLHAREPRRLLIRNAMVIYGNARPAFGPVDILVEGGIISAIGRRAAASGPAPDAVIDATGKYVMPGLVNTHMHWHEERQPGVPQPIQYERNLYLASGVTTAREVGGVLAKTKQWQKESDEHRIVSPRIVAYTVASKGRHGTPAEVRQGVRDAKAAGADGLKVMFMDRDQLEALMSEAKLLGLPTTTHIGVEETTAKDYIELGVTSIEHFYGVADAALDGVQKFPADMNYSDEFHRFARAGELYAQADPDKLRAIVELMAEKGVAWSPTLSIYEASRDAIRAQHLPWYRDYLHPSMERFWKPNLENHGSYFLNWGNTQEVRWRQNYRIWMDALRHFGLKGGLITTGDDAGYIYSLYGFGLIRELELHEEAGFHPLEVIAHATWNGARLVGMSDRIGKVRAGFVADLLVVNGNPLENLRLLNPAGTDIAVNGRPARGGGIEWTIKDGIPYHGPTLMREVRAMVEEARLTTTNTP
jgi:imidazolonepropionase-like amidohydrolase